jgi:hypothetical protein
VKVGSNQVFASGLHGPFGLAFYPPGSEPQWHYVANTTSVVRYRYATGDLRARENPEIIVPRLPGKGSRSTQRGHITRDIAFSTDGARLFVSVGSASNDAEALGRRDRVGIARWQAQHGLGAAWVAKRIAPWCRPSIPMARTAASLRPAFGIV